MPEALDAVNPELSAPAIEITGATRSWRDFPYWLVAIVAVLAWMAYLIASQDRYNIAYDRIIQGLSITVTTTVYAFALALVIGLIAGLGRISRNVVTRNIAIFYIELVRGVPILVLISTVAYVLVPESSDLFGFDNGSITLQWRAIIALALIYGAYLGE